MLRFWSDVHAASDVEDVRTLVLVDMGDRTSGVEHEEDVRDPTVYR